MEKTAMVLISCDIGKTNNTKQSLEKIPQIKNIHMVKGSYDIVLKITAPTVRELKNIITWKIRKLSTVRSTLTLKKRE